MDWCRYRFRCVWRLAAAPDDVYAVLERGEEYPRWWPQVREVVPLDDTTGTARFRSLLPYDLVVTARAVRRDPAARVLEVGLGGDLEGGPAGPSAPKGPAPTPCTSRRSRSAPGSCGSSPSPDGPSSAPITP